MSERVVVRDSTGREHTCEPRGGRFDADQECVPERDYAFSDMGLFASGLRVFGGANVVPTVAVGASLLVGGSTGRTAGWLLAGGPAIRWQPFPRWFFGMSFVWGTSAQHTRVDTLQVTHEDTGEEEVVHLDHPVGARELPRLRIGPSLEISWRLLQSPQGSLLLQSTPLILWTNGESGTLVPLGLAFAWP